MKTVVIADDHPLLLIGIKEFLKSKNYEILGAFNNGINCFNAIQALKPNYAILDISMPGMDGIEIAQRINQTKHLTKIIFLTLHNEISYFNAAKKAGVLGYILKEFALDELEICLDKVEKGGEYFSPKLFQKMNHENLGENDLHAVLQQLTPTELKVLKAVATKKSNKEIASTFYISEKTVEAHKANITKKLHLATGKNALIHWCLSNFDKIN